MNSNIKTGSRAPLAVSLTVVVACVLGVSNAFADDQVRTETVKVSDVNVNSPAGVKALYGRIHSAAQRVCSESDHMLQGRAWACAKRAEAQAVEELNLTTLTAYYQIKTGGPAHTLSANR